MLLNNCADVRQAIETDLYLMSDGVVQKCRVGEPHIYRIVEQNGRERCEIVRARNQNIENYRCMHENDLRKWFDRFNESCTCSR